MGSLKTYGAIGGIGKGLNIEATRRHESAEAEKKDARDVQLARQRDKAAQERQTARDKEEAQREKDRYGPGGYAETAATHAAEIAETTAGKKRLHEVQLEEMRQKGASARQTQKITETDDPFDFQVTKASTTISPNGDIVNVPAQNQVTDKTTNVTYTQVGLAFIPEGWDPPTKSKLEAGQKAMAWLLKSPDRNKARENSLTFLQSFGYLPAQYFSKFSARGPVSKLTEKGSTSATTPTNPVVQ